ncbi:2Fe-2S iron-sulfur cluster binding domain-containing protein [Bacillus aquiflavi]|uniref:2Fe-2S iron-sulfur cluster binding domain-containing protein n=1 Tax=Bacillus aquiflavi TaxID=2672567 RepID=A0A6B3W0Y9_9BACI|nr:2Fe-2S iron-sulfur cluster binding domain-containing protein [Bacillus aquiflavi]MBA4538019.1 2Fe-2S iron-sulfur cluster binding domain-containing protein [Bacillus aquiflavi]NEY82275.1 2Fe-2S iron-sulfur cluster binding domain-containing protein [Bacillus aquiflavi]UAC48813.1 2Fe-2S iron-sulfur cluster binding domain-containing protein [Bacillus aquiflavi]
MFKIMINPEQSFYYHGNEDLLRSAQKNNIKVPFACRGGGCGLCKVKVVKGNYELGPSSKAVLTDRERKEGYVLACKTYPLSEMEIELISK